MTPGLSRKEEKETATTPTTEEAITTPEFSNKEELETAITPTTEEVIMTIEYSRKEELETNFSSTTTKVQKSHTLTPYIPPHRRFGASNARKDKKLCLKYKIQK